jgi:hypothetical protein
MQLTLEERASPSMKSIVIVCQASVDTGRDCNLPGYGDLSGWPKYILGSAAHTVAHLVSYLSSLSVVLILYK